MNNERNQGTNLFVLILIFLLCDLIGLTDLSKIEHNLHCIVCKDCPEFDPVEDVKKSVPCNPDEDEYYCVKRIRRDGKIDRSCGKQYMCKPPEKLPRNGTYVENHCCQCDDCNHASSIDKALWTILFGHFFYFSYTYF